MPVIWDNSTCECQYIESSQNKACGNPLTCWFVWNTVRFFNSPVIQKTPPNCGWMWSIFVCQLWLVIIGSQLDRFCQRINSTMVAVRLYLDQCCIKMEIFWWYSLWVWLHRLILIPIINKSFPDVTKMCADYFHLT